MFSGGSKMNIGKEKVNHRDICEIQKRIKSSVKHLWYDNRGGSRAAATSKMERFVIIVNG